MFSDGVAGTSLLSGSRVPRSVGEPRCHCGWSRDSSARACPRSHPPVRTAHTMSAVAAFADPLVSVRKWCAKRLALVADEAEADFYVTLIGAVHARLRELRAGDAVAALGPPRAAVLRKLLTSSSLATSLDIVVPLLVRHDELADAPVFGGCIAAAKALRAAQASHAGVAAPAGADFPDVCAAPASAPVPTPGRVLIVAGSDSSGGAGIQADLKVCEAVGAFGMTALTALTAQNTHGVTGVHLVDTAFVKQQMDACDDDVGVDVVKTGMLPDPETVDMIAEFVADKKHPLVVDPVMVSASGCRLASSATVVAMKGRLLPRALVATPNLHEAAVLLDREGTDVKTFCPTADKMEGICKELHAVCGAEYILLKGGHMDEASDAPPEVCVDMLYHGPSGTVHTYEAPWVDTTNTHGTGCTLASCLAAHLAKGFGVVEAMENTKRYLTATLRRSAGVTLGSGPHHPMIHSLSFS